MFKPTPEKPEVVADRVYRKLKRKGVTVHADTVKNEIGITDNKLTTEQKNELKKRYNARISLRIDRDKQKTIKAFEEARKEAFVHLPKKIKNASYRDLVFGLDRFTNNHRLLTDKSTENVGIDGIVPIVSDFEKLLGVIQNNNKNDKKIE